MADIFEQTLKQLNEITDSASQKVGAFFKKAINKGEEYAVKGKIQIEIEKLKWDLKQLYAELGRYVALKNRVDGVMTSTFAFWIKLKINVNISLKELKIRPLLMMLIMMMKTPRSCLKIHNRKFTIFHAVNPF